MNTIFAHLFADDASRLIAAGCFVESAVVSDMPGMSCMSCASCPGGATGGCFGGEAGGCWAGAASGAAQKMAARRIAPPTLVTATLHGTAGA